jgi:hypothetical protein
MSWAAIQATDSPSTSACSLASSLSASWAAVILALSAIVVSPFVALLEQTDDHEARDGRTHIGHAALLHHDPRLDPAWSCLSDLLTRSQATRWHGSWHVLFRVRDRKPARRLHKSELTSGDASTAAASRIEFQGR